MQIFNKIDDLIFIRFPIIFPLLYYLILTYFPNYEIYLILIVIFLLAEPHFAATWPIFIDTGNKEYLKQNLKKNYIDKNLQVIKNINLNSHGVRRLGAASLDMCHVAKGIVEGFWEYNLQPWDTAAGNIIVTEAGGTVSNENGNQYNFDKCIVVSNNKVHKDFLKIINDIKK